MNEGFINEIYRGLPSNSVRTGSDLEPYGVDRTRLFRAAPSAVLLPRSTEDVAFIVNTARAHRQSLVPSGGRTGYAGGAVAARGEVVVSLDRMTAVLGFDPWMPALSVQAGITTLAIQQEAEQRHLFFPVDFASAGSSQVGGNLSTHAGGIRVLRYGTIRRYAIGLTAVAGTGEILTFPGTILKNNTGYDLKELFIGSEGTLGIITEATLQLVPRPPETTVALFSFSSLNDALECLATMRSLGLDLFAFEILDQSCLNLVLSHTQRPCPFSRLPEWVALAEFATSSDLAFIDRIASEEILPAEAPSVKRDFWMLRENISESLSMLGLPLHKNDVSLPPGSIPSFIQQAREMGRLECPDARLFFFGHAADGNLHLNVVAPPNLPEASFRESMERFDQASYSLIQSLGGSISAEHGIGLLKRNALHFSRTDPEIRLMREIKKSFDPDNILNPGKVLP